MTIHKWLIVSILLISFLVSCSSVRQIRPLDKGESAVTISLGGPITELGDIYSPLPLLSIGYTRGLLSRKLELEMGLHITEGLYGVLMIDGGLNYRPILSSGLRPGIIVSPKVFFTTDFSSSSVRIYPDLNLTSYWKIRQNFFIYLGLENWFEFSQEREDGNPQDNHWLIVPYLGLNCGNEKLLFQFESRVYTPNLKNTGRPTKNIGLGDNGILGFFIGLNYTIQGRD